MNTKKSKSIPFACIGLSAALVTIMWSPSIDGFFADARNGSSFGTQYAHAEGRVRRVIGAVFGTEEDAPSQPPIQIQPQGPLTAEQDIIRMVTEDRKEAAEKRNEYAQNPEEAVADGPKEQAVIDNEMWAEGVESYSEIQDHINTY